MLNEEVIVITKLQKYLKDNYHSIGENMMSGGVDNMEKYSICWAKRMHMRQYYRKSLTC